MKILLTGSTGYIASNLLDRLIALKYEVYVIIRKDTNLEKLDKRLDDKHKVMFDSPQQLCKVIKEIQPELFIHLATLYQYDYAIEDIERLLDANITFGTILLDAVMRSGCQRMINTSSILQHYEDENYNPTCLYAATKGAYEKIIDYYVTNHQFRVMSLELFDTYGPCDPRNKIFNILKKLSEQDSLDMSKGEQYVNLCYVDDVVDAYIEAIHQVMTIEGEMHEKYSVRGNECFKLKELVELYAQITEKELNINWGARPYRKREIMKPWSGRRLLPNWEPKVNLYEGIQSVHKTHTRIDEK